MAVASPSLPPVAVPPGSIIDGRYEVKQPLGSGTFGEVYEVLDHHQQQVVALKLLNPALCGVWPWQEAVELTRLRSEYILTIWNASIVSGVPYVVTAMATSGSAERILSTLPWPTPAQAVRIVQQAARGVGRAHDDGVLHRDIKLENLFLDVTGAVRLGDFGIAHPLSNGVAPTGGTVVTMAPEVLAGGPTTVASDIYSLGCCLYQLLAGCLPYVDQQPVDEAAFRHLVATSLPTPLRDIAPHVGRSLAARLERALDHDPAARYQSATELDADLGQLPTASRHWRRSTVHTGHSMCWESADRPRPNIRICVVPAVAVGRFSVEVAHLVTNRRILRLCRSDVRSKFLLGALRTTFEKLGN